MTGEGERIPVIVTISGRLDLVPDYSLTGEEVLKRVSEEWGIDLEKTELPFVVVHDQSLSKYQIIGNDEAIGEVDGIRKVIRAVLPLKEGVRSA